MTSTTPGPAAQPTASERVKWMGKNSTRLIIALIVIVIAALVVVFSFSIFGSSSANPGNTGHQRHHDAGQLQGR